MYVEAMATKTISLDMESYDRLCRARRDPRESFSTVIKRARWAAPKRTCGALQTALDALPPMSGEVLDRLDRAQCEDAPPEDPWKD
jgi:predicted CopG family antitoxin